MPLDAPVYIYLKKGCEKTGGNRSNGLYEDELTKAMSQNQRLCPKYNLNTLYSYCIEPYHEHRS